MRARPDEDMEEVVVLSGVAVVKNRLGVWKRLCCFFEWRRLGFCVVESGGGGAPSLEVGFFTTVYLVDQLW